jgi:hypothetical protein
MRAIYRFPLPDSHVSLSAVLEPGPNPQPAPPPRPTTGQSNLPQNQGASNPKPTPPIEHDTRPSRSASTQSATPPEPTTCERTPDRLRKLFPPQAPASAPIRLSTPRAPNRPGQHCDAETAETWAPMPCFSRCAATYQLKALTEQGSYEHCTVFLKALTAWGSAACGLAYHHPRRSRKGAPIS